MNRSELRFKGKVAIVTGAGGGLGREYALLLAERGAAVVVNDLGGTRSGEGSSSSAADRVVQEIRSKGGKAVADYNSVEDGDKIVKTAVDNFGRIDILINNAGILRDKSFLKITPEDWDLVHRVHLRGSFLVSRAAWPYFRKQNYGRIIVTASGAGIYGNFGQANYASAKLGLIGLSNTLAVEGAKYGIHCNTIVPLAGSRLTQDIFPEDWFDHLKPEYICPVVVWLCHEDCPENGGIFEAAGGWVGKYRWQRSLGKVFVGLDEKFTPESVRDNWLEVTNMTEATNPTSIHEHTSLLVEALSGGAKGKQEEKQNVFTYNHDHAILYALGVGMSTKEPGYLKFLYEGSEDFHVLPTFGTIISMPALLDSSTYRDEISKLNADPTKLLHGEQYIELFEPLPPATTLISTCKVTDVLDKGSGAIVVADVDSYNESGVKIMTSQWSLFFVGAGGFGGKRSSDKIKAIAKMPSRKPDISFQEKTSVNQAALYRLCGDKNPLHIDPDFAAMGGFKEPIMHGLCVYGYAARHVLKHFANGDTRKFKSMKARFSGPIIPGNTIQTDMWREGNRIIFQCTDMETGKQILSGGYIDLEQVTLAATTRSSTEAAPPPAVPTSGLKTDFVFAEMGKRLSGMPEIATKTQAIFEWNITKDGKPVSQWILDLKNGAGSIYPGPIKNGKANTMLTLDDEDMVAMVTGKLDPRKAFMSGKLKIKGNIMLTQKLASILSAKGPASATQPQEQKPAAELKPEVKIKSDVIFVNYERSLARNPHFMEIQNVYVWNITKEGKLAQQWTMDLKNGKGGVYRGPPKIGKADCTITLDDDIMMAISDGRMDPQKAFMSGKLRISGNVLASEKLNELREDALRRHNEKSKMGAMAAPPDSASSEEPPICVKSDIIFKLFAERLQEEPEIAQKMKVVYHWNVLRDGKKMCEWTVDLKTGTGAIYKGPPNQKADVVLTLEDEDTIKLMTSKLNPQRAFMTGKLKIKGNIMLTQKLNQLWQEIIKSGRVVELPLLEPILSDKPLDRDLYSEYAFLELTKKLSRHPDIIEKVQAIFQWEITKNSKTVSKWTMELKDKPGCVYRGEPKNKKADCVISIDDQDFNQMVVGRYPAEQFLCKAGRASVTGNVTAAEKLAQLFKLSSKL